MEHLDRVYMTPMMPMMRASCQKRIRLIMNDGPAGYHSLL